MKVFANCVQTRTQCTRDTLLHLHYFVLRIAVPQFKLDCTSHTVVNVTCQALNWHCHNWTPMANNTTPPMLWSGSVTVCTIVGRCWHQSSITVSSRSMTTVPFWKEGGWQASSGRIDSKPYYQARWVSECIDSQSLHFWATRLPQHIHLVSYFGIHHRIGMSIGAQGFIRIGINWSWPSWLTEMITKY